MMSNTMGRITDKFLERIFEANPRQKKSVLETLENYFEDDDYIQLEEILAFYLQFYSLDRIADAYISFVGDTAEETRYFLINGRYRYSSFADTEKLVYSNREYMEKYMIGLALSGYLWSNHIRVYHWFKEIMSTYTGERYLEVGPGHGRYFCEAVKKGNFQKHDAIDLSETSVEQTKRFISATLDETDQKKCTVFYQDAYSFEPERKYDFVVIAEVLEHLEDPERMLKKLNKITRGADRPKTCPEQR